MHRSLVAAVSAAALTSVLVASSVALVPSSWIPMEVSAAQVDEGQRLFDHETFGGNGRTCRTCHSGVDGTIDLAEVARRLSEDPSDPLFLHDGLDDFFSGTSRIAAHATILIERELPKGVVLVDDPSATSVVLRPRGPEHGQHAGSRSGVDVRHARPGPAGSGVGCDQSSRAGDRLAHGATTRRDCPSFSETDKRFFSSKALKAFAEGGPAPVLPQGQTASRDAAANSSSMRLGTLLAREGACALCHSGPMLNTSNEFTTAATGAPPGWRAFDIGVSSRNLMNNPVHTFAVTDACNNTIVVRSPDPGIMMTGVYNIPMLAQFLPPKELCILHPAFFANMFKTPQLHGVRHTAPYFHDNSAKSLEDVMEQYRALLYLQSQHPADAAGRR